jgi:hypothetical protein
MAQNINRCQGGRIGKMLCVYANVTTINGKQEIDEDHPCKLKMRDRYVLYPEHKTNGDFVYNNPLNSDPFPYGVNVIWENMSAHTTGLTNDGRKLRTEEIHPLFHMKSVNEPVSTVISDDTVVTVFGSDTDPSATISTWKTVYTKKIQRVDRCRFGVYGLYNETFGGSHPACLRSHLDVPGWVDFTLPKKQTFRESKLISIYDSSLEDIRVHLEKFIPAANAIAVIGIIQEMRKGTYIDLREALKNNEMTDYNLIKFMKNVSIKSKSYMYKRPNLRNLGMLYMFVRNDGFGKVQKHDLLCNLLNFILNYPGLQTAHTDVGNSTDKWWWWAVQVSKIAFKDGLLNAEVVPEWLIQQAELLKTHKSEFSELEEKKEDPPVLRISELLKDAKVGSKKFTIFSRILLAGARWRVPEIISAWESFSLSYSSGSPSVFWDHVESKLDTGSFAWNLVHFAMLDKDTFEVDKLRPQERWHRSYGKREKKASQLNSFWLKLSQMKAEQSDDPDGPELAAALHRGEAIEELELDASDLLGLSVIDLSGEDAFGAKEDACQSPMLEQD